MELTLEELTYLARFVQDKNEMGLLSNIEITLKGNEEESLTKKGFFSDGTLMLGMEDFLKTIAAPERCCRLVAQIGYLTVEKYSYYKEGRAVLAQNNQGNFLFSIDSDLKEIKGALVDLYGGSNLKTTTISLWVQKNELVVFAALVDLQRKEELLSYLSGDRSRDSFSVVEVAKYVENPMKNGILSFFKTNFKNLSTSIDMELTIAELAKKSVLIRENNLRFNENEALFAKNFLLIPSVSLLEILNLKENQIKISSTVFLNSSVHDILRIQLLDGGANLSTVTSQEQIDEIIWALNCPELAKQTQNFCPNCGAPLIPDSVFCPKCGTKLNGG